MANIIQYQQRTTPQVSYATPRAAAINPGSNANIFGAVAEGLGALLTNQAKREEEAGRAWAIDAVSQARLEWTSRLQENQANAPPGASGFTENFITEFDTYSAEALKNAPSDSAKKYFHERLADIRTSLGEKAITFEAGARVDYRDTKFNAAIENNQKLMMADPSQFEVSLAETLAVIRESALPPKQRADMEQRAIVGIASSAVWSQMSKSPEAFLGSIGMMGGKPEGGSGAMRGVTGNKAFDVLPFDERVKMIGKAITLKNGFESDAERAADKMRKEKGDEMMKEALARLSPQPGQPRLDRAFIEEAREWVSPAEYKSLLQMQRGGINSDGSRSTKSDPGTYRHLQMLLRDDPERAQKEAFTAHANGLISNSDLSSITGKASTLDRQGGPKTVYERVRQYISGSLDPGPMVQDPTGRGRLASALNEFDAWVEGDGKTKRTDAEIEKRGEEIIRQWRLTNFKNTAVGLPQPRFGAVSKNGSNFEARKAEIGAAWIKTKEAYNQKRITHSEMAQEATRLRDWLRLISEEERAEKSSGGRR